MKSHCCGQRLTPRHDEIKPNGQRVHTWRCLICKAVYKQAVRMPKESFYDAGAGI